jgi:hypothetical protein
MLVFFMIFINNVINKKPLKLCFLWLFKENVSILIAIGVNEDGYREIIGASEGMKEDRESWKNFLAGLKGRGLKGVRDGI